LVAVKCLIQAKYPHPTLSQRERAKNKRMKVMPAAPKLALTKSPLEYDAEKQELVSRQAGLAYPIRAGIPMMLPDAARKLDD
jgi:uncharacterized protein YbaR (Trm112 family)